MAGYRSGPDRYAGKGDNPRLFGRDGHTEFGGRDGALQSYPDGTRLNSDASVDGGLSVGERARVARMVGKADIDLNTPDGVEALTLRQQKYLTPEEQAKELGSVKRAVRADVNKKTAGYANDVDGMTEEVAP